MVYQKILVALDQSPLGEEVLQQAIALAQCFGSSLMLCHCIPVESQILSPYPSFYSEEMLNFSQMIQERLKQETTHAQTWLQQQSETAIAAGIATETQIQIGEPGRYVRDLAKEWQADLIIIGRRGLRGFQELFLGSVSNYVLHHAPCSVLVVQATPTSSEN